MKILVIGSGGREHAITLALSKSENCEKIFCAPGNPGIADIAEIISLNISNHDEVAQFCFQNKIDFAVIGPEQPLSEGIADSLTEKGIFVFGPKKAAAMLESSKDFAKRFMIKYNIPTAHYSTFTKNDLEMARNYVKSHPLPTVIKADGLAAGKGVLICLSREEALKSLDEIFGGAFGEAGDKIVIEEFMHGEEASVFAVCDGKDFVCLAPSQDHKRIGDGDTGKNTGGMGAYSPASIVDDLLMKKVEELVIKPALDGMIKEGCPYVGCLYVGLMIENGNPRVVEFNVRFGDPETQAVLAVFEGDFAKLLYSAAAGKIDKTVFIAKTSLNACCLILASAGYPDKYESGFAIEGNLSERKDSVVIHAGTKLKAGKLVSAGGRVLSVVGIGADLKSAVDAAYNRAEDIRFDNKYCRTDIGKKGLDRLAETK